jgi:hypothetical protein
MSHLSVARAPFTINFSPGASLAEGVVFLMTGMDDAGEAVDSKASRGMADVDGVVGVDTGMLDRLLGDFDVGVAPLKVKKRIIIIMKILLIEVTKITNRMIMPREKINYHSNIIINTAQ